MKYTYRQNLLIIDSKILKFEGEVDKVIEFDQKLIVLLLMNKNLKTSQNVFCVSTRGEILWQVPFARGHTSFGSPYTNITLNNGILEAYSCHGILYYIEPETGGVIKKAFIK
jgi:hypothetical protein